MILTLIGFMGAGKSKVGRLLAERLGWTFVDLDARIERRAARTIADIFARDGEKAFRGMEARELARALASRRNTVLSVGGGAPCFGDNLEKMKRASRVVYLSAPFKTLMARAGRSSARPLIRSLDRAGLSKLLAVRLAIYDQAHETVDTGRLSVAAVAERIHRNLPDGIHTVAIGPLIVGRGRPSRIICVVGGPAALRDARAARKQGADLIEARIDWWPSPKRALTELARLRHVGLPVIATIRWDREGGRWPANAESRRLKLFERVLAERLADCVDIEWNAPIRSAVLKLCAKHRLPAIVSWHDFFGTPPERRIEKVLCAMSRSAASIIKTAVMAHSAADTMRVIRLARRLAPKLKPMVMIAMGGPGRETRLRAGRIGSCMTYGYCGSKPAAPGQVSTRALKRAFGRPPRP